MSACQIAVPTTTEPSAETPRPGYRRALPRGRRAPRTRPCGRLSAKPRSIRTTAKVRRSAMGPHPTPARDSSSGNWRARRLSGSRPPSPAPTPPRPRASCRPPPAGARRRRTGWRAGREGLGPDRRARHGDEGERACSPGAETSTCRTRVSRWTERFCMKWKVAMPARRGRRCRAGRVGLETCSFRRATSRASAAARSPRARRATRSFGSRGRRRTPGRGRGPRRGRRARVARLAAEPDRKRREGARPEGALPGGLAGQGVARETGEELLEGDARLEPREVRPRQKCVPWPKARWRGRRATSKRSGSWNWRSSRLAAPQSSSTSLRAGIATPWRSTARVVRRGSCWAGESRRSISSIVSGTRDGSSASRRCADRWRASSAAPFAIRFAVVSLPAVISTKQNPSSSAG